MVGDKEQKRMAEREKYFIVTFGCQMNEHDSEVMAGLLEEMGYQQADSEDEARIILVNTCCVRQTAENKVYGLLGRLRKYKQASPSVVIGVGGCMTQQEEVARRIKQRFPFVDLIFGTHNLHRLPHLLESALQNQETICELLEKAEPVPDNVPIKRAGTIRAWVVITYGCDNFCTYCIVPYVRGRERSRRPEDILSEIRSLAASGYKEITLLGQNVNSYGKDLQEKIDFADLLVEVNKIEGLERIRFVTSHPRDFTRRLIDTIASCEKVCEHIHLPVQAGSNRVLQIMNRGYTREYYFDLIEKMRQAIPGLAITTDIMVGFPGEEEEDFAQTLDLVERVRFDNAFMFIYNLRPGTPAASMPNQVPDQIKRERIELLIKTQNRITKELNLQEMGKKHQVLVEGESKTNPRFFSGRTRTNKLVLFPGSPELVGKCVDVRIANGKLTYLEGKVCN